MADHAYWADADLSIDANAFGCVLNGNVSCALGDSSGTRLPRDKKKTADPVGARDARTTARMPFREFRDSYSTSTRGPEGESHEALLDWIVVRT